MKYAKIQKYIELTADQDQPIQTRGNQKSLAKQSHLTTKSSTKKTSQEKTTKWSVLCKTKQHIGWKVMHQIPRTIKKPKQHYKVLSVQILKDANMSTPTTVEKFKKQLKNLDYHMIRQYHTDQKPMELPKGQCDASKKAQRVRFNKVGLAEVWWPEVMMCYCILRNIVDVLEGGKTAYEKRFGEPFKGPRIPCGAEIKYVPSYKKDKDRCHQLGTKTLSGIFLGYKMHAGGKWSNELIILDWEQLNSANTRGEVHKKTLLWRSDKDCEVWPVKVDGEFQFPLAEGELEQPGQTDSQLRVIELKRSRKLRKRERARQAEEENQAKEEAEEGEDQDIPTETKDFWTVSGDLLVRHHRTPRLELFIPTEDLSPIPLKYIDVLRRTETDLESQEEKTIKDIWLEYEDNLPSANRELSDHWTGRTIFTLLRPKPPDGQEWIDGRLTRKQKTTRPPTIWPEFWERLSKKNKYVQISILSIYTKM